MMPTMIMPLLCILTVAHAAPLTLTPFAQGELTQIGMLGYGVLGCDRLPPPTTAPSPNPNLVSYRPRMTCVSLVLSLSFRCVSLVRSPDGGFYAQKKLSKAHI